MPTSGEGGAHDVPLRLPTRPRPHLRLTPRSRRIGIAVAALAFVVAGLLGAYRYVHDFWLYRGFPAPKEPAFVTRASAR